MNLEAVKNPVHIYFNRFWPGFLEGTDPNNVTFYIEIFKRVFGADIIIENDINNSNILCENACNLNDSVIYNKHWTYSILITGESVCSFSNYSEHYNSFTCFLSGLKPNIALKRVKFPLCISYLYCNSYLSLQSVKDIPKKLVCAVISNPNGYTRNKFLNKLEQRVHVEYGGNFRNNIGYCIGGHHNSDELINFMKQYKFVITMENNEEDYYITEKICNGFFAGIIPVYWGSPNIAEYFNSNRFLYLKNDSDDEIDNIIEQMINMDDETYLSMINSTILINPITSIINTIVDDIINTINSISIQ